MAPLQAVMLLIFLLSCSSSERTLFGFVDTLKRNVGFIKRSVMRKTGVTRYTKEGLGQ